MSAKSTSRYLLALLSIFSIWLVQVSIDPEQAYSDQSILHPDSGKNVRKILITLEGLDTMQKLPGELGPLPRVPVPRNNPMTAAKVELGKKLFFDPRLSGNDHWSCATCHNPSLGFSDGLARSLGFGDEAELDRHTPTVLNVAYNTAFFWDGRAETLEEQAVAPIQAAREMNSDPKELEKEINSIPEYKEQFKQVFGRPARLSLIGKAIAAFERTLITGQSAFDRYMAGDKQALRTEEKRGLILFISKAACTQCHNGPNFTDNEYHNIGVPQLADQKEDSGRFAISTNHKEKRAFKTPTLRNIVNTPPYMHNGSLKTLEEVVDFYDRGGGDDPNKSEKIFKLNLTTREKKDLIAFLNALTGSMPIVSYPELPQMALASSQ